MNRNANQVLNSFPSMWRETEQDNGHSSDLDHKRNGTLLVKTVHKENGTELQSKWCWHLHKANTQSSDPRVHYPEECSEAKVVENCQYTFAPTWERLKLFFAQLFLLISSVFTEQSQSCVKNANPAKLGQGDLFWWDNLTHWLCRVPTSLFDENTYTFDRWSCARRSVAEVPRTSGQAITTKSCD